MNIRTQLIKKGDPPPLEGLDRGKITHLPDPNITMFLLPGGMKSGKSSVFIVVDLPDGGQLAMETSLALLKTATATLSTMDEVHGG